MKILRLLVALVLVPLVVSCSGDDFDYNPAIAELDGVKAYIASYYNNKVSAVSITFDDGYYDQYTLAVPELEKRDLPATFFITGKMVYTTQPPANNHMDVATVRDLVARGFEVGNHTWSHAVLTQIPPDSAKVEIEKNDSVLESWTGVRPMTMSFPTNARNRKLISIAMQGKVGVRTFEEGFGQTYRKSSYAGMRKWVDETRKNRKWGVAMLHGIEASYDHWENSGELWSFFDYLCSVREEVWIASFHDVVSYVTERDISRVELFKTPDGSIQARLSTPLDTSIYKHPLTIVVEHAGRETLVDLKPGDSRSLSPYLSEN